MTRLIAFALVLLALGVRIMWMLGGGYAFLFTATAVIMYLLLTVKVLQLLKQPERRFLLPFWNCVSFCVLCFLLAIWYAHPWTYWEVTNAR